MIHIVKHLLVFVLVWSVGVAGAAVFIPLPWGPILAALLVAWLLWGYLLRPGAEGPAARWELLRLRPLEGLALRETLRLVLPFLLFTWAVGDLYVRLVPVPAEAMNPFGAEMETTRGRLAISVLAVGIAPLVEELFFRGLIQHRLERRLGARAGVGVAAGLFALVHFNPWIVPPLVPMAVVMGFAVYATRSIWSAVILHASNNAVAMIATLARAEREIPATPTLWESGPTLAWWTSLAALAAAVALLAWSAQRLWDAGRGARLRHA